MQTPKGPFTVQRILNNNAVMANTPGGQDVILLGKGMGFGRKVGDILSNPKYEKIYVVPEGVAEQKALALIEQVDPAIIKVTEEIIQLAKATLGKNLHPRIHIALADHINFTLIRLNQGMEIKNPFIAEIEAMYPKEFSVAKQGAKLIMDKFKISIPREEVGFIALHLHSARHDRQVSQSLKHTAIINKVVKYIETKLGSLKERGGIEYTRLLSHLQSCIHRLINKTTVENPFIDKLKQEFSESYVIAKQVGSILEEGLGMPVPEDEIGYLTMHIERIRRNLTK
ncbi:transcriptional antiterminator [Desulfohalotomaculum tongense]|uniref:PRD domain-containing protein n=1 Tax=Desulforadius tongensis TaxID=1216062 RepID=UPI001959E861|nr:PRD domain-containing protein [Desulforadius tongensis]MBM7855589.1 transcriptional antiterminator [Desulforadius tongensis]